MSCTDTNIQVTLTLLPQTVHGKLCRPVGITPDTVQLLVHGGTYSGRYWDLPYGEYSYQREMGRLGRATFAIDLLGSGTSSQPLSTLLTGITQASVVHQVVSKLRTGQVLGLPFDRIVLVGHSMGSGIAIVEATSYHDVDGVVLTGMTHSMDALMLTTIFVDGIHPAILDPLLASRGGDAGYITTIPGARHFFHDPGTYEPGVLTADETTKDQVSSTMVPDLVPLAFTSTLSRAITVPVLMANGTQDTLFCAFHCTSSTDLLNAEAPYFTSGLDVVLLPNAGHSLALSTGAPAYRSAVDGWLTSHFE
ncbi:alpha/beta fold hydrolase [Lentzea sp. NBRC 105346]|uniref:alpha/beta hydrolase n=1 Tax=Lentzea sp. NBRC 105346 TaxID=3032205 RepID=UPI0025539989|nr:alpha/beta fold hydrolase [Lentzea sp. NBRC 105346]